MKIYEKPFISVIEVADTDIICTSSLGNDGSGSDEGELEWGTPVAINGNALKGVAAKN